MSEPDRNTGRPALNRLWLFGGAFLLFSVGLVAYGMVSRATQNSRLRELTEAQAVPSVAIIAPIAAQDHASLDLPGRLEAYIRAPIYARVPGYLKSWRHDIGDQVKAGDVLAEIDAPDLDQQLAQARADLSVAEANAKLAQISAERWQSLASTDAVAQQDVDQRTFTLNANVAQVKAAQANVDRLIAEQGFKHLIAPFNGVVTARDTDIGALINVGAAGGAELFVISETRKLRVYVNVPQNYAPSIPVGTMAKLSVPEYPGRTFPATVAASAQSVDVASNSVRIQLVVDNSRGELMTGDFTTVTFDLAHPEVAINVPASALIFNKNGLHVAIVDHEGKIVLKEVTITRDLGNEVEIGSGIAPDDRVVANPPDGIASGDQVHVAGAPGKPGEPETAEVK